MADRARWVQDADDLARVVADIGRGPVGVDTEADSYHHYREKVCLVQLSFDAQDVLVDPLADFRPDLLAPLLQDRGVRKVLHGADYDLRLLHRDFGLEVQGLFDTMIAARLAGETEYGLAALLENHLGVSVDKRHQLADWSRRPLPETLIEYAAADTRHLVVLAERLQERLERRGRLEWADEEFRRLEKVRWSPEADDPEAFRKVKGGRDLDGAGLVVLRELYAWRDAAARERDVPPFKILGDSAIVAMCRERPRDPKALARVPGFPRRRRGRVASELLELIERALSSPRSEWPDKVRRPARPPRRRAGEPLRRLREQRDELASELGIEPTLIATRGMLEAIVERLEAGESWRTIPDLRSWQVELLAPRIPGGE